MSQCFAVKGIGGADQATLGSAEILVKYAQLADKRARVYVLVSTWLVVWGIWHVYFVEAVFPNAILWLHYYAASYEFGFVRRGLGGELIRMLTGDHSCRRLYRSVDVYHGVADRPCRRGVAYPFHGQPVRAQDNACPPRSGATLCLFLRHL